MTVPPSPTPLRDRFEQRFEKQSAAECWPWKGKLDEFGYGGIKTPTRRRERAHRVAYELYVGPIPRGLTIDHLCRNRACVNPGHLEAVTRGENTRRGLVLRDWNPSSQKTHCPQGHPYDDENTYIHPTKGSRICLTCKRKRERESAKKKREANPGEYAAWFREYRRRKARLQGAGPSGDASA